MKCSRCKRSFFVDTAGGPNLAGLCEECAGAAPAPDADRRASDEWLGMRAFDTSPSEVDWRPSDGWFICSYEAWTIRVRFGSNVTDFELYESGWPGQDAPNIVGGVRRHDGCMVWSAPCSIHFCEPEHADILARALRVVFDAATRLVESAAESPDD